MKLDGNTFKRLQHIINELSAIDLTEDEIIRVAVAGLKAHRHRRKGTTFTPNQLQYQLKKLENEPYEFYKAPPELDEFTFNSGGNVLTKLKLWFEDVIRK